MSANTVHVTDADFPTKVLQSELPVVVDFWAPWCGPCRMIAPALEELAGEYSGRLVVAKVNTDEDAMNAQRLRVQGIPTLVFFAGGREVDRVVGALPKAALRAKFDAVLAGAGAAARA
jgi:thioredoxin 1